MKKLFLSIIILSIFVAGCKKNEDEVVQEPAGEGEIVFAGHLIENGQMKSTDLVDDIAEYAVIEIKDGYGVVTEYIRLVHYIDGIPYTQAIKLPNGSYTVEKFCLMDDNQTPGFDSPEVDDDVEIWACPMVGSEFAAYVDKPTAFDIEVPEFGKIQIDIEVLRFIPDEYLSFGFHWFVIEQSVLREHCFFGNLCIKSLEDYADSWYQYQTNGVQMDLTAIFKIKVYQDIPNDVPDEGWVYTGEFSNINPDSAWWGEGRPLCVMYEDYLMYDDMYKFEMYVYVADGPGFDYKHFITWEISEADLMNYPWPPTGEDNVTEFVIGTCNPIADTLLPPYMDLPETAIYEILNSPGVLTDSYIDADITVDPGYDIWSGVWPSWCFDHQVTIEKNTPYIMDVYSSLYPWLMPIYVQEDQWDNANWLMNHLGWYPGYDWDDIQGALWLMDIPPWNGQAHSGVPALGTLAYAQQMHDDAMAYGEGYLPPPGGWAAVIFIPQDTPPDQEYPLLQTVFIVVDP